MNSSAESLSMADADFLNELKSATADAHAALENTPLSKKLLDPDISVMDYREYLEKMYSLILFTEEQVAPSIADFLPDLSERSKLSWLEQDLKNLGSVLPDTTPYHNVQLLNVAEQMGWYYVVEGSTLGGRVILKSLQRHLPPHVFETSAQFFNGYGESTGRKWKSFLAVLDQYAQTPATRKSVIDGANKAFLQIQKSFNS